MEFDEVIVKEGPALCRCCLTEGALKDLDAAYPYGDQIEVYAEMLLEAFDICISRHMEAPNDICDPCILQLRDAYHFKKKVQDSERRLLEMMDRGELQPKLVIHEADMKKEPSSREFLDEVVANLDDYDFGDDPELEEPLQNLKKSKEDDSRAKRRSKKLTKKKLSKIEKKAKLVNVKKAKSSDIVDTDGSLKKARYRQRRRNLQTLFNHTTVIPFKWRAKFRCFYCGIMTSNYTELRTHTENHGKCSINDKSIIAVKGGQNMDVKIDISFLKCKKCNQEFASLDDITKHLSEKHELKYEKTEMVLEEFRLVDLSCHLCEEKFNYFGYLVSHMNNIHPSRCHICDKCNQKFNKRRDLFCHIKYYHREGGYQCEFCPHKFGTLNILRKHQANTHLTRCNICSMKLPSLALKEKHIEQDHPECNNLQCDHCFKVFRTKQGLKMHTKKCQNRDEIYEDVVKKENKAYDSTEENFEDKTVKREILNRVKENIVTIINTSTAIPFSYYKNKFNCFYCSEDFTNPESLREHTIMFHPTCDIQAKYLKKSCKQSYTSIKLDIATLSCKICYETFTNIDNFLDHLTKKHDCNFEKTLRSSIQPYKLIKDHMECPFCPGEVFRFFNILLRHINAKHTDNNIVCMYCGLTFRKEHLLRVHIRSNHREGQFKCTICDAECTIQSRLTIHMAKVHGVKAAKCSKCGERFATQYLRQKHMSETHNAGHKCSFCDKVFVRNSFMKDHVRRTHLKEKDVECSVCNMKFFNKIQLKSHMVKHIGEKNFHCDVCGERFLWRKGLVRHMGRHNKSAVAVAMFMAQINVPGKKQNSKFCKIFVNTDIMRELRKMGFHASMVSLRNIFDQDRDEISAKRSNIPSKRRRKNLEILFNNTTVIPFKWRGKYLCFYCGKDIAEYTDLKKHTVSHGRCSIEDYGIQLVRSGEIEIKIDISDITCEICNEPFPNLEEIILHLKLKHNLDYDKNVDLYITTYKLVDLTCLDCGESFPFFRRLVNHVNTVHPRNVLVCDKCSQTFNKRRDLASHVRNYHKDGGYSCDECELEFVSKTKLRAHKESDHLHTCNVCFEKFSSSAKKVKHIDETHLRDGVLQCGFCQRICSTRQAFLQHTSKCKIGREVFDNTEPNNTINLDDIDEKKPTVRVIRNNLACIFNMSTALPFKFFMNRFRCFYCPKDFSESEELRQHTVLEHPMCDTKHRSMKLRARDDVDIKLDISSLNCKVCYETMPDLNTLIDHLVMEHKAVYDKTVDCKIVTFRLHKENFLCPLCTESEVYKFFGNLLKHMNVAHSNNQLICVFCGKSFRTDPNLRSHIARHHRPAKLKCETCELVFTTGVKLNTHLARAHGKKVVKCPKCPEQFLSSYSRQKHLISVHNFGSTCPHCGRMFTRNSLVRDHIRRIHLKEKTVECPVCSMKFFDHFMLKMHMVRHAGDRNFHCDKCGKKFLWKKNLKNHMSTHEKHAGSHNVETPI